MLTTIEEEVLELCTNTVTKTPITSPATGLVSTSLFLKMSPAARPVHTRTHRGKNTALHAHYITWKWFVFVCLFICLFVLPPTSWKAELRTSSEQINM